jgi:hypothetical protein
MAEEQQVEDQQQQEQTEKVEDQFAEADAKGAVEDEAPPPSLEDIAARMGWVPKEKFNGNESDWKPADQFIIAGKDIQRSLSRDLKELRGTLDTVVKTNAAIYQDRLAEQRAEIAAKYEKAVDGGDHDAAFKAANEIIQIDQRARQPSAPTPAPEAIEWGQRNSRVMADPLAAQRAIELCEPYARAGKSAGEQLAAIEPMLKREFPHLFETQETKAPPGVSQPATRMNGSQKRSQTAADLPKEAREIARDMLDRGLIKSEEDYARNYFAQAQKGK